MKSVTVGRQRIILGSCVRGLFLMRPGSVDVVVTSPPYNLGIKYSHYEDRRSDVDYLGFIDDVARGIARALKPNGSVFLNVGYSGKQPWVSHDVALIFRRHLVLQNRIAWVKSITIDDVTRGQFKPLNSPRFLNNTFEDIYHFTSNGAVPINKLAIGVSFASKANIRRFSHGRDRRCRGNTWFVRYETTNSHKAHPAAFPVELAETCIKLHGGVELLVLDPFVGSGSTLLAAQKLGHRGIGFDIDREYCQLSANRIRNNLRSRR